jgi:WXG100 family type VII secretion target
MAQTAAKFDSTSNDLSGMLQRLSTELDELYAGWAGHGANAFQQVRARWAADTQTLQRALTETANAIRTAGTQYTSSDEAAASRSTGIGGGGVSLPL